MPVARRRTKAVERVETKVVNTFYVKLAIAGVFVLGSAFFIGKSDSGQISVTEVIQNSATAVQTSEDGSQTPPPGAVSTPDALRNMPNGGLVPQEGVQEQVPPAPAPEPEPTASTTEESQTQEGESGVSETVESNEEVPTEVSETAGE